MSASRPRTFENFSLHFRRGTCIFSFNWVLPAKSFELLGSSPLFVFFYLLLHYSVVILHCVDLCLTGLFFSRAIKFRLI